MINEVIWVSAALEWKGKALVGVQPPTCHLGYAKTDGIQFACIRCKVHWVQVELILQALACVCVCVCVCVRARV